MKKDSYLYPSSPTEAAFHKEVAEIKQRGLEQQKEEGLEELTVANIPAHDPTKPIGRDLCVFACVLFLLQIHNFLSTTFGAFLLLNTGLCGLLIP